VWILQVATEFRDVKWIRQSVSLYASPISLRAGKPPLYGGDTVYGQYFDGIIDEVRIYDRALTQEEIQRDMENPISSVPRADSQSSGLVAAYSFDEGAGGTVADASGNSNTGRIKAATWTKQGKFGSALMFNGSDALVIIDDSPVLLPTSGMTLEAWVYPTAVSADWRDVVYKEVDKFFLEATSSTQGFPVFGGKFVANPIYAPAVLPRNTWTHLAGTFDGKSQRVYFNGVQVANSN
jgi:hypothetical protein